MCTIKNSITCIVLLFLCNIFAQDATPQKKRTSLLAESALPNSKAAMPVGAASENIPAEKTDEQPALPLPQKAAAVESEPALPLPSAKKMSPEKASTQPTAAQTVSQQAEGKPVKSVTIVTPPSKPPAKHEAPDKGPQIPFSFDKKPLVDIIDQLAEKKSINIILPQVPADLDAIKRQTITFHPQGKTTVSLNEAWNLLTTFLELSGYALAKKRDDLYVIVRVARPDEPSINREVLPLYVSTPYDELPDNEQRIRYIYYLRNLRIPTQEDRDTNPISRIFKDMLTSGGSVVYEPKANGFIITDKANVIASVMRIIANLDKSGFKETIEVLQLEFVAARDIVKVFDSLKKAAGESTASPFYSIRCPC